MGITVVLLVFHWIGKTICSSSDICPELLSGMLEMTGPACNVTLDGCSDLNALTIYGNCTPFGYVSGDTKVRCITSLIFESDNTAIALYNETQQNGNVSYLLLKKKRNERLLDIAVNDTLPDGIQSTEYFVERTVCPVSSTTTTTTTTTTTASTSAAAKWSSLIAFAVIATAAAIASFVAWHIYKQRNIIRERNERRTICLAQEINSRRNQSPEESSTKYENIDSCQTENHNEDNLKADTVEQNGRLEQVYEVIGEHPSNGKEV